MSIKVTIQGGPANPADGRWPFTRILEIDRIESGNPRDVFDHDAVNTYSVALRNTVEPSLSFPRAGFQHRYGDDLLTLVSEAIDALGGRGDTQKLHR